MPFIDIGNMIVLVTDKEHPRYQQVGKMLYHDWRESGIVGVQFSDGHEEEFSDGLLVGDSHSKIKRFYRRRDSTGELYDDSENAGPLSLKAEFVKQGGSLEELAEQYRLLFDEDLPKPPIMLSYRKPSDISPS